MSRQGTPARRTGGRVTQKRIAELAGVSQAVVSLVLNGKADAASRIPDGTRERVEQVIRETGYTADPAARRLAGVGNKIIGVFTYEPVFPTEAQDFYTPLLAGIEAEAELLGCDLLMFTSAPVRDGRRSLLHSGSRLRLADGCLLLGVVMDPAELTRLVTERFPFVAVGRRDVAEVPYVGLDYVTATASLVRRAVELGHRRLAYLHLDQVGESVLDRRRGVELGRGDASLRTALLGAGPDAALLRSLVTDGVTAVVVETAEHAERLWDVAASSGITVPDDLSLIVLAENPRPRADLPELTRLRPARSRLGAESLRLLGRILDPADDAGARRLLIDCDTAEGTTLAPPG